MEYSILGTVIHAVCGVGHGHSVCEQRDYRGERETLREKAEDCTWKCFRCKWSCPKRRKEEERMAKRKPQPEGPPVPGGRHRRSWDSGGDYAMPRPSYGGRSNSGGD